MQVTNVNMSFFSSLDDTVAVLIVLHSFVIEIQECETSWTVFNNDVKQMQIRFDVQVDAGKQCNIQS